MGDENPTVDQVAAEESGGHTTFEESLKSRNTWVRLAFMLIFYVLVSLASLVGTVVVVLGFLWRLVTGEVNRELREIGQSLASYLYEIVRYLTYNTDEKPFPFGSPWPSGGDSE